MLTPTQMFLTVARCPLQMISSSSPFYRSANFNFIIGAGRRSVEGILLLYRKQPNRIKPASQPFLTKEPTASIFKIRRFLSDQESYGDPGLTACPYILTIRTGGLRNSKSTTGRELTLSEDGDFMETLRQMKFDLIEFHQRYDWQRPEMKLLGLQIMQRKKYFFKHRKPLRERREQFLGNSRNIRFFKRPCFVCNGKSECRHHIISLNQGGCQSAKRNIVSLCNGCHANIHPWLKPRDTLTEEFRKVMA